MDNFDDTRVMVLICHHDIPLFFANIDMPGEQQKSSLIIFFLFLLRLMLWYCMMWDVLLVGACTGTS